jgi:Sec-independent protein translocase protein TatA
MAFDPLELLTIGAIILVFFLWGPQKIPELARVVAQARREFDNASKEFQKVSTSIQDGSSPFLQPTTPVKTAIGAAALTQGAQQNVKSALPPPPAPPSSGMTGDQLLIEAARKLGIHTQGKTREQIQMEIITMAQRSPPAPADPQDASKTGDSAA